MSSETTTLLHREELQGRRYPLYIERLLLVLVLIGIYVLHPKVVSLIDGTLGMLVAWCGLPLFLLLCAEMIGRFVQSMHKD